MSLRVPATRAPSSSTIASIIIATSDSSSTMKIRRSLRGGLASELVFTSFPAQPAGEESVHPSLMRSLEPGRQWSTMI